DLIVTGVQTCALPIFSARATISRSVARDAGVAPERPTEREIVARALIEPRVEQDAIRLLATRQVEHLLALGGGNDPVPTLRQHEIGRASCRERVWICV